MAYNAKQPKMLDLDQFESLDHAVQRIQLGRQYEDATLPFLERLGDLTILRMFFMSAIARARALHEGIVREIEARNPHSSFPLIRQFAESVALVWYIAQHPEYVHAVVEHPRDLPQHVNRKSIQAIIDGSKDFAPGLKAVYAELCEITHFGSTAVWTSFQTPDGEDRMRFTWQTGADWKGDRQGLVACAQTLELALAMRHALRFLGEVCVHELTPAP